MPASKKDLKKQQQKQNQAAGLGDSKGRMPSRVKVKLFNQMLRKRNARLSPRNPKSNMSSTSSGAKKY